MGIVLTGMGSKLPSKRLSNVDLSKMVDTSDEWIASRTGIKYRHFLDGNSTSYLVEQVCKNFDLSDDERQNIKAVIVTTLSSDYAMPNLACFAQSYLNLGTDVFFADCIRGCAFRCVLPKRL